MRADLKSISNYAKGKITFEILWEPNLSVINFAQNNGKELRHHPDSNQRKVVTNPDSWSLFRSDSG